MLKRWLFSYLSGLMLLACQPTNQHSPEQFDDLMASRGLDSANYEVLIRSFKLEQELEVWVKTGTSSKYALLKTYPVCRSSGNLGPKRKEGDRQVPEGFYHIDRLNPNSSYHLSLGLNYPNKSDRIRGDQQQPGSDIFIHGACVTVGCIPLTDPLIEEVYLLVETAKKRGQKRIPVHVLPGRMQSDAFQKIMEENRHLAFWQELQPIYQYFEQYQEPAAFSINDEGQYSLLPE